MASTPTITGEQRRAIYDLVHDHLSALGDVRIAMDQEDYATAERFAREFSEDFRLLADLGWDPRDDRDEFALTMPLEDLTGLLRRWRDDAIGGLSESPEERRATEAEEASKARFRLVRETCEGLLGKLGPREGGSGE